MKKVNSVGIDVSKKKLDVAMKFTDTASEIKTFSNNEKGVMEIILFLKTKGTTPTVPIIIESTGDYHLLATIMIFQEGFKVKCINPLITKKYQKSSIRNSKNDKIDAKRLAEIGLIESDLPEFNSSKDNVLKKKLIASIAKLEKLRQQLKKHTKQLQDIQKILGEKIDLNNYESMINLFDKQIKSLKKLISQDTKKKVKDFVKKTPGLSEEQMAIIEVMFQGKTFSNRDKLVAFTGLDIMERKSGVWKGKEKLSKRGNSYLRKVLFQIAWGLMMHNDKFKEYYNKLYVQKKKHYTATLVAIARKFLRYYYSYYYLKS